MGKSMRAAVWIGGREFRIEERSEPQPGPGEVRVRVHACGVCLTEVHTLDGLIGQYKPPRVVGHEYGGTIEALGPDVSGLEVGMAVACAGQGGFAEQIVVPSNWVFPIPAGVSLEEAAQVEPLLCCLAAIEQAEIAPGATVLITGAGPMGLMLLQLARKAGAARIIVSELIPERRAMALKLGADAAIDPRGVNMHEAVAQVAEGGVDRALETAGHPVALADCISATKEGGMIVMVGVNPATARIELDLYTFHRRNLTLRGSYGDVPGLSFQTAASSLGQIDLTSLVSHRFDLADIAEAFDIARTGRGLKVLVGSGIDRQPGLDGGR